MTEKFRALTATEMSRVRVKSNLTRNESMRAIANQPSDQVNRWLLTQPSACDEVRKKNWRGVAYSFGHTVSNIGQAN